MTKVVTIKGEQYDQAKHSNADAEAVHMLGMHLQMIAIIMHEKNLTVENIDIWLTLKMAMDSLKDMISMQAKDKSNAIEIF
jgi:hypothetical protein